MLNGEGNENGKKRKKTIGLISKKKHFTRAAQESTQRTYQRTYHSCPTVFTLTTSGAQDNFPTSSFHL